MQFGVETTHRMAELALEGLRKAGLSAIPRNFELWYAHLDGRSPSLTRDIEIARDAFGKISQQDADALYRTHLQRGDLSRSVVDIVSRFNEEVSDLHEMIEKAGESAVGNNETLGGISEQLRQSTEDYPAVGALLEGVFSVAKDMRVQNEMLESRLAESTSEINTLQRSVENIEAEAMKDPLTGVANRARFDRSIQQHLAETKATDEPLTLLLADIDHFKGFNDSWGHQTGDQVLRLVAEVMNSNIRGADTLARYGGEEFAVLLPGASLKNAAMLAERIRSAVECRRLKKRRTDEDLGTITMSIGVAAARRADTVESFIERADECLYAAKNNGRNLVVDEGSLSESKSGVA
jgi:diguanylate cyclase